MRAALAAMPFLCDAGARYQGYLPPDCDDVLRLIVAACAEASCMAFVFAEQAPPQTGEPYQRLWDRTDDLADALQVWKAFAGPFPDLRPGEIVRLCP